MCSDSEEEDSFAQISEPLILLVDRGGCTFVRKVKLKQKKPKNQKQKQIVAIPLCCSILLCLGRSFSHTLFILVLLRFKVRNAQRFGADIVAVLFADNVCRCSDTLCINSTTTTTTTTTISDTITGTTSTSSDAKTGTTTSSDDVTGTTDDDHDHDHDDDDINSNENDNDNNNYYCEPHEPILANDGSALDITIPSFLIFKLDGDAMKNVLVQNTSTATTTTTPVRIDMELRWSIPPPDDHVEYDLFFVPGGDAATKEFFTNFKTIAMALGRDQASFTPHTYIFDGVQAHCDINSCSTLCTNHGRYCASDPDDDLDHGVSGADVVEESLRRLCIWQLYGPDENGIRDGVEWWDYVQNFEVLCHWGSTTSTMLQRVNIQGCVRDCYTRAAIDQVKVEKCMLESGGLQENVANSLLDRALADQLEQGIILTPTAFVNDVVVSGEFSLSHFFQAICEGYAANSTPALCHTCNIHSLPSCFGDPGQCAVAGGNCASFAGDEDGAELLHTTSNTTDRPVASSTASSSKSSQFVPGLAIGCCVTAVLAVAAFSYDKKKKKRRRPQQQRYDDVAARGSYSAIELT
jgi:hypothetical protein